MKIRIEIQRKLNDRIIEREKAKNELYKLDMNDKEYIKINFYIFVLDQIINELKWILSDF